MMWGVTVLVDFVSNLFRRGLDEPFSVEWVPVEFWRENNCWVQEAVQKRKGDTIGGSSIFTIFSLHPKLQVTSSKHLLRYAAAALITDTQQLTKTKNGIHQFRRKRLRQTTLDNIRIPQINNHGNHQLLLHIHRLHNRQSRTDSNPTTIFYAVSE